MILPRPRIRAATPAPTGRPHRLAAWAVVVALATATALALSGGPAGAALPQGAPSGWNSGTSTYSGTTSGGVCAIQAVNTGAAQWTATQDQEWYWRCYLDAASGTPLRIKFIIAGYNVDSANGTIGFGYNWSWRLDQPTQLTSTDDWNSAGTWYTGAAGTSGGSPATTPVVDWASTQIRSKVGKRVTKGGVMAVEGITNTQGSAVQSTGACATPAGTGVGVLGSIAWQACTTSNYTRAGIYNLGTITTGPNVGQDNYAAWVCYDKACASTDAPPQPVYFYNNPPNGVGRPWSYSKMPAWPTGSAAPAGWSGTDANGGACQITSVSVTDTSTATPLTVGSNRTVTFDATHSYAFTFTHIGATRIVLELNDEIAGESADVRSTVLPTSPYTFSGVMFRRTGAWGVTAYCVDGLGATNSRGGVITEGPESAISVPADPDRSLGRCFSQFGAPSDFSFSDPSTWTGVLGVMGSALNPITYIKSTGCVLTDMFIPKKSMSYYGGKMAASWNGAASDTSNLLMTPWIVTDTFFDYAEANADGDDYAGGMIEGWTIPVPGRGDVTIVKEGPAAGHLAGYAGYAHTFLMFVAYTTGAIAIYRIMAWALGVSVPWGGSGGGDEE